MSYSSSTHRILNLIESSSICWRLSSLSSRVSQYETQFAHGLNRIKLESKASQAEFEYNYFIYLFIYLSLLIKSSSCLTLYRLDLFTSLAGLKDLRISWAVRREGEASNKTQIYGELEEGLNNLSKTMILTLFCQVKTRRLNPSSA